MIVLFPDIDVFSPQVLDDVNAKHPGHEVNDGGHDYEIPFVLGLLQDDVHDVTS